MNANELGAKILSDHKDLRGVLQALEEHLEQPTDSHGWLRSLRETLAGLLELCTAHFRLEEETGVHVQLREDSPHLASRLERLASDHSRILEELKKLVAALPHSIELEATVSLKATVLGALDNLREHERAESAIMMDAYWDDLGGEGG